MNGLALAILQLVAAACVGAGYGRIMVALESLVLVWAGLLVVPLLAAWIASWGARNIPRGLAIVAVASVAFLAAIATDSSEIKPLWQAILAAILLVPMLAVGVTGVLVGHAFRRTGDARG